MNLIQTIKQNLINIPGWRTNRKIIVFESDDWGSIRMPSRKTYEILKRRGLGVEKSKYDALDCLENKDDLYNLFELLSKYNDRRGNPPIFTFNTVMGNPDFNKIRENNFEKFYHEHFFDSYLNYLNQDLSSIWKDAMGKGLMQPQYHAREHLNTNLWMNDLKAGFKETRKAFKYQFFGLKTNTSSIYQNHYLAAYRAESENELSNLKEITKNGLSIFKETFGFESKTLIACNYVWPKELESFVADLGVMSLQGQIGHIAPNILKKGKVSVKRHYTGQKNSINQIYTVRNVIFEPFESQKKDWVDLALRDINNSFFWKKPAIISSHRINYVSGMDHEHSDRNLKSLDMLLQEILKNWPDVEFLSSDKLGELIINSNKKQIE